MGPGAHLSPTDDPQQTASCLPRNVPPVAEVIGSIISIFKLQTFLTHYKPFYPRKKFYIFQLDFSILKEQEQTSQKLTPTETHKKPKIIRKAPNLSSHEVTKLSN